MPDEFIELHEALAAARERVGDLSRVAKAVAAAKAREIDQELATVRLRTEQRIAAADAARMEAEARLSEMRDSLQQAEQDKARIGADLAKLQGEMASIKEQAARLAPSEAAKAQLEREVAELREAARTAADDTRQLIEALAAIGLAAGPLEADAALLAESETPSAGERADGEGARAGDGESAHLDQRGILGGRPAVFPMLAALPLEERLHVQSLLADLHSKLDERGLMTTVPGELLFAVGSDEVQAGTYDTLAKVAELIGMYDNRQVLIIGHSDATGDAAGNRQLSERRAERVKQIFVDDFEIAADRLSTEGIGDARPIASNATPQGRRANRRVEVLILN
jgi:outer membrane protein OmpA-like peptidoglycan-associated protein